MEVNHFTIGKSDERKLSWRSSPDDQQLIRSTSSKVRSYTCSFCKKGFSNAQALGGHMNIHRRDRAKLIEAFDDENLLSLNSVHSSEVDRRQGFEDRNPVPSEARTSEEESSIPKTSSSLPIENDDTTAAFCASTNSDICLDHGEEDKKLQMTHGSALIELDLELRLGTEPLETSLSLSTSTSTSTTATTTATSTTSEFV